MARVDLHTHSIASPDGSLTATDYEHALSKGTLDYIAITDHDRIDFALEMRAKLGDRIIVGEEITTQDGEIIGLYLQQAVQPGLSAVETVQNIHEQGGLVYIPHPFETVRKGITVEALDRIMDQVDIIEIRNGRSLQNRSEWAVEWAAEHDVPGAASSDAHGRYGWGNTCSTINGTPAVNNLAELLRTATYSIKSTGVMGRLYPKLNRLRRLLRA